MCRCAQRRAAIVSAVKAVAAKGMTIISAPMRKLDFGNGVKIPLFQHSASVIGGNSGGAIYDENGMLIGTLTGGVRGADISLAVPVKFAREMIRKAGFGDILH